jgi:hypothetical protein
MTEAGPLANYRTISPKPRCLSLQAAYRRTPSNLIYTSSMRSIRRHLCGLMRPTDPGDSGAPATGTATRKTVPSS